MTRRHRSSVLPAVVGAAAALLALSTLGLTWVRRSVEGPLGQASAEQVEALSGRDVAPVVAALVPGTAAVVVVALLLRGWWRAGALVVGALSALWAAVSAAGVLLPGGAGPDATSTATPAVAAVACLLAAVGSVAGAVSTVRTRNAEAASDGEAPGGDVEPAAPGGATRGVGEGTAASVAAPDPEPADLWRALDDGRDPT